MTRCAHPAIRREDEWQGLCVVLWHGFEQKVSSFLTLFSEKQRMSDKCQAKGFSMTAELNNFATSKEMKNEECRI